MFRSHVMARVASIALVAQVACSSSSGPDPESNAEGGAAAPNATSPTGGSHPSADAGAAPRDGAAPASDAGHASADAGAGDAATHASLDASAADAAGPAEGGASADAGPVAAAPATLSTFTANQSGRGGADLVLTATGVDATETAFGVDVHLQDSSGKAVLGFTDWKGAKSGERVVLFDGASAAGQPTFTRTVTLAGYMRAFPNVAKVAGSVSNQKGSSNSVTASVTALAWPTAGQGCDPNVVINSCPLGQGCTGTPPLCTQGVAPQIAQFAYIQSSSGPRILAAGTDLADDLSIIHLAFLDQAGHPVLVDMTGNGDYQNYYDVNAAGISTLGAFFDAIQAAPHFDTTVTQIVATPIGASTGSGAAVTAAIEPLTLGATGSPCDVRGYSGCVASDSCVAGVGGATVCEATTDAQAGAAAVAPVLDPAQPSVLATGYTTTVALWGNPPQHCLPPEALGFPQGIARLHLSKDTASLTLTAGNPETTFPNALFVLTGTGSAVGGTALGCNGSSPSTLTLKNMTAGDYTVVINSRNTVGGQFGISVK